MPYLCPSCHSPVTVGAAAWTCAAGHTFGVEGGVVRLVTAEFAAQLARFRPALEDYRTRIGRRLLDPAAYPLLPGGPAVRGDREWEQRQHDLRLVQATMRRHKALRVLDLGAYNGWLSHHMAAWGHDVTGVEPFTDPYDGLGAAQFYSERWLPIQLDLLDLSVLPNNYDLVILNRCLAFFPDPAAALRQAMKLVAPGGWLLALGLQVFGDPRPKAARVAALEAEFQSRYGLSAFLWPTRGYLDMNDQQALGSEGLIFWTDALLNYPHMVWANLKAHLKPSLPRHYHGWWSPDGD